MRYNNIISNLQNLTNREIKQVELAKATGITRATMNYRKKYNIEFSYEDVKKIEQYFNITFEENKTNETNVPVLGEVYASMGNGLTVYDENQTGTYSISNQLAKELGVNLNKAVMIFASGDSMKPTIFGGDSLLVDTSKTDIYDGRIYCVRIDGQLYAKRLQKIPPDRIKVVSDNQEKYDAFYVDKDSAFDFAVIGEIRWWGRVAKWKLF